MYEKPDSIIDIYAEAYGYEKLGITDAQLLQQKEREKKEAEERAKADWLTATTDGTWHCCLFPLSLVTVPLSTILSQNAARCAVCFLVIKLTPF